MCHKTNIVSRFKVALTYLFLGRGIVLLKCDKCGGVNITSNSLRVTNSIFLTSRSKLHCNKCNATCRLTEKWEV